MHVFSALDSLKYLLKYLNLLVTYSQYLSSESGSIDYFSNTLNSQEAFHFGKEKRKKACSKGRNDRRQTPDYPAAFP